ncbi:hypothetical protein GCM10023350_15160 [Nocardioides endophyticus]|uniref:Alpha/beta hydrolase n=1 Tax=Nocardioides endophyticus TaxID=1353775 RepID=A0ABP8YMC2_9ACTN
MPRHTSLRRGSALITLLLLAALLTTVTATEPAVGASPTGPGTIVHIKGYDVYVALPDGSGERRLTTNGSVAEPWI